MAEALPELITERLRLRVPTPSDAAAMCRYATENRDHLAPWDPVRPSEYFTLDYWAQALERLGEDVRAGRCLQLVLEPRDDDELAVLGVCTLSNIVRGVFQAAHLGYALDHRAVGRGLMTEALTAVTRHAFAVMGLHRIMANYMPTNVRSAALLRRLGFVPEGYARDYLLLAGHWQDHVLTALVNPTWRPQDRSPRGG